MASGHHIGQSTTKQSGMGHTSGFLPGPLQPQGVRKMKEGRVPGPEDGEMAAGGAATMAALHAEHAVE